MSEELKEAQQKFIVLTNQIDYNLQEFELKTRIEVKIGIFKELQSLFIRLDEDVVLYLHS